MPTNLDRRAPEGSGREIPPMTKEILEARTRKSIEELRQLYNTDERLVDLANEIARPGEIEAYAESGRSLQNEIREIMKTHESKESFFSKAGRFLKKGGKWALRNWLPLTLAGVGLYGYVNRGPIMQWGTKKVNEGVEWLSGKIGGPIKAQLDAMRAQYDALHGRYDALTGRLNRAGDAAGVNPPLDNRPNTIDLGTPPGTVLPTAPAPTPVVPGTPPVTPPTVLPGMPPAPVEPERLRPRPPKN